MQCLTVKKIYSWRLKHVIPATHFVFCSFQVATVVIEGLTSVSGEFATLTRNFKCTAYFHFSRIRSACKLCIVHVVTLSEFPGTFQAQLTGTTFKIGNTISHTLYLKLKLLSYMLWLTYKRVLPEQWQSTEASIATWDLEDLFTHT